MIGEEEMDEMIERARAIGTDYTVLADMLRLMAEVRHLRLRDAEAELEAATEESRGRRPSQAAEIHSLSDLGSGIIYLRLCLTESSEARSPSDASLGCWSELKRHWGSLPSLVSYRCTKRCRRSPRASPI